MLPKALNCLTLWASNLRLQGDSQGCVREGNIASLGLKRGVGRGLGCGSEGAEGAGDAVALSKHLLD